MYNGVEEIAKMFKDCKNPPTYSPVFGTIEELPNLKIRRSSKIVLTDRHIKSLINLYDRDSEGNYIYLKKTVAMLPYNDNNNYLVLGVVRNG